MSGTVQNPVLTLEVDDQVSPGAAAAAASLDKLADSATTTETKVAALGVTASSLVNRLDPVARAQANLATQGDILSRGLAAGTITGQQYAASMETLQQRVTTASNAHLAAAGTIEGVGNQTRATTMLIRDATGAFAELSAGMSPLTIAALHMGNLEHATETFGAVAKQAFSFITSGPGLALGAAALFGGIALAAEAAASRVLGLSAALQAVNGSGAGASAQIVDAAARGVASTGTASLPDATTAATAFANNPATVQSIANIERLTTDSANLAVVWGITVPDAARKMAAGMNDPGKLAQDLANSHFNGMNDELARSIQLMGDSGDKAAAYAQLLSVVEQTSHDAANTSKTELQQALAGLSGAFVKTGADGKTFADTFGAQIDHLAAGAVVSLTNMLTALEKAYGFVAGLNLPSWMISALSSGASIAAQAMIPGVGLVNSATNAINGAPTTNSDLPRGIRNNNPLNLSYTGQGVGGAVGTDGRFAIYPDMATGIAANQAQLLSYQNNNGLNTVASIVAKWAPPGENNTGGYALSVAQALGVTVDQPIDLNNPATLSALTQAMSNVENGRQYNLATIGSSPIGAGTASNPLQLPPVNITASGPATTNNPNDVIQTALTAATAGSPAQTAAQAAASVKQYNAALVDLAAQGVTSGKDVDVLTAALTKATLAQFNAIGPAAQLVRGLQDQTDQQNQLAAAWGNGYAAEGLAVAQVKAEQQARTVAAPGTAAYTAAVVQLTAANVALAAAQQSVQAGAALADQGQQLQMLQAQTATLGESAGIRAHDLAVLQEQQTIAKTMPGISQQEKDQLVAGAAAIADQNTNLQQTQAALTEVGSLATQAFDQIGSAISNSFLSGTGSAINWGNTVKAVVGTVIQEIAKLAILNPILNSVTGSSSTTLLGVLGALGGSSTGTTGISTAATAASAVGGGVGSGGLSNIANLFQLSSAGNTLAGSPISFSGISNYLGLGGANGGSSLFGTTGLFGSSGYAANLLATPLTSVSGSATSAALAGGAYGPETLAAYQGAGGFAPITAGGALGAIGGIGAGYGVGSLAGGYLQGALDKTGPAPQIGAAAGAIAGAAGAIFAPETFGLSIPVAALLGGAIGGIGGGLIGPHTATPYSSFGFNLQATQDTGTLVPGQVLGQGEDLAADQQQFAADLSTLNNILEQNNIKLTSLGGITQIGNPIAPGETDKAASVSAAIPNFGFTVTPDGSQLSQALAGQVNGVSFASADALQAVITEVDTFVNTTLPGLTTQQTNIGSLQTTINSLSDAFTPAIAEGTKLGVGVDALTAAYNKQTQAAYDAANQQTQSDLNGFQASYLSAAAQVSGSPQDAETAALYSFDNITSPQAEQQLTAEYQGIFGDAYATTQNYVAASAALEKSLGEQRLAIQTQYGDQITQAASQQSDAAAQAAGASVTSLLSYIQTLQGSSTSPLSAQAQYGLAQSQFNAVSGAAQAGDANSIGQLPTYGTALLTASRAVNGSGAAYASDYSSVLSSVSSVASLGADVLTQSFMNAAMQSQTAAIVASQQQIIAAIAGLQTALSQAAMAPSRIAA